MKNLSTIILVISISFVTQAQVGVASINGNNADALLSDIGIFFNQIGNNNAGYEIPSGSGKNSVYSASFWFGGIDVNNQIKLAAPHYYTGNDQDFWPGALALNTATTVAPNPLVGTIWVVEQATILNHIQNYNTPGYSTPWEILNWPAHGDVGSGQAYHLAPFVDIDSDGNYEPLEGEYPCIKGDVAAYTIVNDKGGVHGSGGDPIGVEVHYMFYQYFTANYLNDVTFMDLRVINRGTQTLYDFYTSFFIDADLGSYTDDYFGSDSTRNMMFYYNADSFDEDNAGHLGYGSEPPALAIVSLSDSISSADMFTNGMPYPYNDPSTPIHYYNVMQGLYNDGSPWLDNNNVATKFWYSGNPLNSIEWSELSAGNQPGDRRSVMSIHQSIFQPAMEYNHTLALVWAQGVDNLNSVALMYNAVDSVQDYYDNFMIQDCYGGNVGLSELDQEDIRIWPNPSNGRVNVDLSSMNEKVDVEITDAAGKMILAQSLNGGSISNLELTGEQGIYFIKLRTDSMHQVKALIIE